LINPVPIDQNVLLMGTELDFGSGDATCMDWFTANPIPDSCQWKSFNGLRYSTCREDAMSDILDSGSTSVGLAILGNNSEIATFNQLGAENGLTFVGPLRGVLPIGPDGVDVLNALNSNSTSLLIDAAQTNLTNSYTLALQGITSNISCNYDTQSPVRVYPLDGTTVQQFNGTCPVETDFFPNGKTFTSLNSTNSLAFWACKSPPEDGQESSYFFYLRGYQSYATSIGNITCTASPMQPAIYNVSFTSGIFQLDDSQRTVSGTLLPGIVEQAVGALGQLIADSQTQQTNLVASTVTAFGVKYLNLSTDEQQPDYLPLYGAMVQGILDYEVAYSRLLYSTISDRPPSCSRDVNGTLDYMWMGLLVDVHHVGFLMPVTLINLVSLILILVAMFQAKKGSYKFDITSHEVLAMATYGEVARDSSKLARRLVLPSAVGA